MCAVVMVVGVFLIARVVSEGLGRTRLLVAIEGRRRSHSRREDAPSGPLGSRLPRPDGLGAVPTLTTAKPHLVEPAMGMPPGVLRLPPQARRHRQVALGSRGAHASIGGPSPRSPYRSPISRILSGSGGVVSPAK
jgi:hypothetical protein